MKYTNLKNLPGSIVAAIENDDYDAEGSDITASRLPDSPRVVALTKKHRDQLTEDASDAIWLLLGKAIHYVLEKSEPSELTELRLFTDCLGWKVSGAFDHLTLSQGKLVDFKITSVWTIVYGDRIKEWTGQLNILAELVDRNSDRDEIKEISVIAILRDWSKHKARDGGNYPAVQVVEIPLELWPRSKRSAYLEERVSAHQEAQNGKLPECSDDERWASGDVWAVKKGTNVKAKSLHETEDAAKQAAEFLGAPHWVEHRKGASKRCEAYCAVGSGGFCEQWNAMKPQAEAVEVTQPAASRE